MKIYLVLLTLLVVACKSGKIPDSPETDKILFLAYEVKKDSADSLHRFSITNQIISEGSFHYEKPDRQYVPGDFIVTFLDKKDREIFREVLPDPLKVEAEAVADDGRLIHVTRLVERGELLLRVPYTKRMEKISILLYGNENKILFHHPIIANQ
jgi:hypothetical protein